MLNKYLDIKTAQAIFLLDGLVVLSFLFINYLLSMFIYYNNAICYRKATSFIIEGFNPKKQLQLFLVKMKLLVTELIVLRRGSTLLNGKVVTVSMKQYVIRCCSSITSNKSEKLVNEEDENAF